MHITPPRSRWLKRGFLGLPLAVWALIATAATALAVVGFIVVLGMTGQVTTGSGIDVEYVQDEVSVTNENVNPLGDCDIIWHAADDIEVLATGLIALDTCTFQVEVANNSTEHAAKLQSFDTGFDGEQISRGFTIPEDADFDYCGYQIDPQSSATIKFRIEVNEFASTSYSHDFDPGQMEGLRFVRADLYNDGDCTH